MKWRSRLQLQLKEGWSTFFLLWAMLLVASTAIMQTELIEGLHIIPVAVSAAMFAGLLLAKSAFKDRTAHFYSLVFGLFITAYLIGIILPGELPWRERVLEIASRQSDWLQKAIEGGTSRDGLIFVIQTTAVYWILGYTAAWYTFRHPHLWRVILPSGLVLLSVVYYYTGPRPLAAYLAAYTILSLLYAVRTHVNEQEIHWRSAAVRYDKGIWFTFLRAGLLASLVLLLLSWSLPAMSANTAVNDALSGTRGPWREFQDNWTRLFSSLRTYGTTTADPYQDALALGGPRTAGNTLIMDIYVPRPLRAAYWQAIAYDTYENGTWRIAEDLEPLLHYPDDGPFPVLQSRARQDVEQAVHNYIPNSSFIYAAPELVSSDKQMLVDATRDAQGNLLLTSARSRFVLRQGDIYHVTSRVSTADKQALRGAGQAYPDWVTQRYLQVPDSVTAETKELAAQLAAPFDNPFDKTIAVRDYLRNNISYNDQIEAPPDGAEPIHHVLFETKKGYCNYYASAMAIMLRSQGIPSRVVSGYAQGEYDEATRSYRVRANNAHTWVEAYFPQFGWIQFEPTVSLPAADLPESTGGGDAFASPVFDFPLTPEEGLDPRGLLEGEPQTLPPGSAGAANQSFWADFAPWQAGLAALILLLAVAVLFFANDMNKRVEGDIDRSYRRLGSWAGLLGILYGPSETPYERAERITSVVPEGRSPIRKLTHEYVRKRFSRSYTADEAFNPQDEWRELRPLLLKKSIGATLRRWGIHAKR
jgi:transglutaminase-like putative cysteine protease